MCELPLGPMEEQCTSQQLSHTPINPPRSKLLTNGRGLEVEMCSIDEVAAGLRQRLTGRSGTLGTQ